MVNQYSVDFKLKIVKMILNEHISKHEIERTHHVSRKTQRDWVSKYDKEEFSKKYLVYLELNMSFYHISIFQSRKLFETKLTDVFTNEECGKLQSFR